jgi:hypothetical protein
MNMQDYKELVRNRELAAASLLGCAMATLETVRAGMEVKKNTWRLLDEARLAYECACRDLDECFCTEAMRESFKD